MSNNNEDNKVVLIGEMGVGKTCIIEQFISNDFNQDQDSTITAQFCKKDFEFPGGEKITLDIWDTAGQEKFRALTRIFYKNAKAVIIVYSITNKQTFDEAKNYWYEQVKQNCHSDVIIAIAANKCDLYEQRQVEDEEGEKFAKSVGAFFASTSAKNDSGITNLFENIAMKILDPNFDFTNTEKDAKEKYENIKGIKKEITDNKKDNNKNSVKLDGNIQKKKKKCC